jgi:hypothetical protein
LVYFAKRGFGQVLFEDGLMTHGGLNVSEPEIRPFRLSCLRWPSVSFFMWAPRVESMRWKTD